MNRLRNLWIKIANKISSFCYTPWRNRATPVDEQVWDSDENNTNIHYRLRTVPVLAGADNNSAYIDTADASYYQLGSTTEQYAYIAEGSAINYINNIAFNSPNQLIASSSEIRIGNIDQPRINIQFDSSYWSPTRVYESSERGRVDRVGVIVLERIPRMRERHVFGITGTHNESARDGVHGSEDVLLSWDTEQNT